MERQVAETISKMIDDACARLLDARLLEFDSYLRDNSCGVPIQRFISRSAS
jgi:hypothetical protein